MLNIIAAASVAVQPVQIEAIDFDLRELERPAAIADQPAEVPVYDSGRGYATNDPQEAADNDSFNRGVEQRRVAFHVLNAADLGTTLYCVNEVRGCEEANPIYGQSQAAMVAGKVGSAVLYEVMLDYLRDSGDRNAVRWYQYGMIVIHGGVVAWNTSIIF